MELKSISNTAVSYPPDGSNSPTQKAGLSSGTEDRYGSYLQPYVIWLRPRYQRIVTDSWLYDREVFRVLTEFITQIDDFVRSRNLEKTNDVDLVLEVVNASDEWWCGYYFVQHSTRLLFWLEPYIVSEFLNEVKGDLSPSHVGESTSLSSLESKSAHSSNSELQLQCQYWWVLKLKSAKQLFIHTCTGTIGHYSPTLYMPPPKWWICWRMRSGMLRQAFFIALSLIVLTLTNNCRPPHVQGVDD